MSAPRRRSQPMADINVTPMIDVLLVLLIVFMVAVPITTRGLNVKVPAPAPPAAPDVAPPPAFAMLQIHAQDFELGHERHPTLESLERAMQDFFATRRDRTLVVRPDGDVEYGRVVLAMDLAKGAGVDRIGIVSAASPRSVTPQ